MSRAEILFKGILDDRNQSDAPKAVKVNSNSIRTPNINEQITNKRVEAINSVKPLESPQTPANLDKSFEQKQKAVKLMALDSEYARIDSELSNEISDLQQKLSNQPEILKERISHISDLGEVQRIGNEFKKDAENINKQILKLMDKRTLIRAKRELLPLTIEVENK